MHHLQQLLYYLSIGDVVIEGTKIVGEVGDADAELVDGLAFLEGDVVEVPAELLHAGLARALIPDPHTLDCILGLLHHVLPRESALELEGHRVQETRHHLLIVVVAEVAALLPYNTYD
jgi:hypothetical protein